MPTATIIQPVEFASFGIIRYAETLKNITQNSTHSHEITVHRLLCDLEELAASQRLDRGSHHTILGKAADVADFFNYDIELLCHEQNSWYRASVINQMGQGMLHALERIRPDLTALPFFTEAVHGLRMEKSGGRAPVSCRPWAQNIKPD